MNVGKTTDRFLVVGSGFSGSLLSAILARNGKQVTLIDRQQHPRFMIGESSTPAAGLILRTLINQYGLSELQPLAQYGTWIRKLPNVQRGIKRGFSYFFHQVQEDLQITNEHHHDLLVAASATRNMADTHWFREDVDHFLCGYARRHNVDVCESVTLHQLKWNPVDRCWTVSIGSADGQAESLQVDWVIDASGQGEAVAQTLGLQLGQNQSLKTNTFALFSHFNKVASWDRLLASTGQVTDDFPFPSDDAAQHHIIDNGWLWCLRFDHGVTSAGVVLDHGRCQIPTDTTEVLQTWDGILNKYPGLRQMFEFAQLSDQPGRLLRTERMQRIASTATGPGWVSLPHTAGFIDPLHSTGIAHTLSGVERLAAIFLSGTTSIQEQLDTYSEQVLDELKLIDLLVAGCYQALPSKRHFETYCMLYFAAATSYEMRRAESGGSGLGQRMFLADDRAWVTLVGDAYEHITQLADSQNWREPAAFEQWIREKIQPYNHAGLCDPQATSMYRYTAIM